MQNADIVGWDLGSKVERQLNRMLSYPRQCLDRYLEIWGTGGSYRIVGQMEPHWSIKPVMVLMISNSREGYLICKFEDFFESTKQGIVSFLFSLFFPFYCSFLFVSWLNLRLKYPLAPILA